MGAYVLNIVESDGAVRFEVRAKPRASRSAIVGVRDGVLHVALAAPPVDGAANEELVDLLARALHLARSKVSVVRGDKSRVKLVEVRGVDKPTLLAMLAAVTP